MRPAPDDPDVLAAPPARDAETLELFAPLEPAPRPAPVPPFERGMARSADSAARWTPEERLALVRAITHLARTRPEFTADEVWRLAPGVPVRKGLAAVLNGAARKGWIRSTGRFAVAARGGEHDHGQRLTVWASLVYGKEAP